VYAEVATLQGLLEGVALPAQKRELIRYARDQENGERYVSLLERLPDKEYSTLDEVGEELAPVQPSSQHKDAELPRDESGRPPGGDDYVKADPTPGAVRHDAPPENPPQKALEQQTKTQNEQKERQTEMLGEESG
jgi:Protein of unknown function (DUF2795)